MNQQLLQALIKIAAVFDSPALHGIKIHDKLVSQTKRGWRAPTAFNAAMDRRVSRLNTAKSLGSTAKVQNHYGGVQRLNRLRKV